MFNPSTSDLAGVPRETLVLWLGECQTALQQLTTGRRSTTVTYAQGDGNRSVTYTAANIAALHARIAELKAQLGIGRGRRAIGLIYR